MLIIRVFWTLQVSSSSSKMEFKQTHTHTHTQTGRLASCLHVARVMTVEAWACKAQQTSTHKSPTCYNKRF